MTEKPLIPSANSKLQFSLSTLLILAVFVGALISTWVRRTPFEITWIDPHSAKEHLKGYSQDELVDLYRAEWERKPRRVVVSHSELIKEGEWIDALAYGTCSAPDIFSFQTRKQLYPEFPEFWWGHFFRAEVWIAIISGGALLVRAWPHSPPARRR